MMQKPEKMLLFSVQIYIYAVEFANVIVRR